MRVLERILKIIKSEISAKYFIYFGAFFVSFCLLTFWNLNHYYHWKKYGDWFYGVGFATALFAPILTITNDITKIFFEKRTIKRFIQLVFSKTWLFLAIANLADELFFNPFIVDFKEYLTALFALTTITLINVNRFKKTDI